MRKLFTLGTFIECIINGLVFGIGFAIPSAFGIPEVFCTLISLVFGSTVGVGLISKLTENTFFREKKYRIWILLAAAIVVFVLLDELFYLLFKQRLVDKLYEQAIFAIILPVIGVAFTIAKRYWKVKKIRDRLEKSGNESQGIGNDEKILKKSLLLVGENKEISGEYEESNSVVTNTGIYVGKDSSSMVDIGGLLNMGGLSSVDMSNIKIGNKNIDIQKIKIANKKVDVAKLVKSDATVVSFLGIPYAKQPIGELRWKAPQPLEKSDKVYEAYYFGASEIQTLAEWNPLSFNRQGEDCLTLNIWKATDKKENSKKENDKKENETEKRPVIVYIHGGYGSCGGSAYGIQNGQDFVRNHPNTIFVSINYRFGILGFIDFSEVPGGNDYPDAPNLGLLDQIEALKWIKENIGAFGGDPDNVTIAGDALGGLCANILAVAPMAKGLFNRVFTLSASPELLDKKSNQQEFAKILLEKYNAKTMDDLQSLTSDQLREVIDEHIVDICYPVCDGKFVPENLYKAYEKGMAKDINLVCGIIKDEIGGGAALLGDDLVNKIIDRYFDALVKEKKNLVDRFSDALRKKGIPERKIKEELFEYYFYKSGAVLLCKKQAKALGNSRVFYWDITPTIDKYGANIISCLSVILGNREFAEQVGFISDGRLTESLQCMLYNFLQNGDPSIKKDVKSQMDELNWRRFIFGNSPVLQINDNKISMGGYDLIEKSVYVEQIIEDTLGIL